VGRGIAFHWPGHIHYNAHADLDRNSVTKPLTTIIVNGTLLVMVDLSIINDPTSASVARDPVRSRLLSELRTPVLPRPALGGRRHSLMIGAYPTAGEAKAKETT
jgi:hypothetical protein